MVGHTHEDIDQFFSCIARYLKKHKVMTVSGLLKAIEKAYKTLPLRVERLNEMLNVRDWIDEKVPQMHGHLKAYQFKFEMVGEEVRFSTKKRSSSNDWTLIDEEGHAVFQTDPEGAPEQIEPELAAMNFAILESQLAKSYSKWMTEADLESWRNDMEQFKNNSGQTGMNFTFPVNFLSITVTFNPISTGLFYLVVALGGSTPSIKFDPDILEHSYLEG